MFITLELCQSPFEVLSCAPQGSALGPLLFNASINGIYDVITCSNYLLFADDVTVLRAIKSPQDCPLLQMDINFICNWCIVNHIKLNISKELFLVLGKVIWFLLNINYVDLVLHMWKPIKIWKSWFRTLFLLACELYVFATFETAGSCMCYNLFFFNCRQSSDVIFYFS